MGLLQCTERGSKCRGGYSDESEIDDDTPPVGKVFNPLSMEDVPMEMADFKKVKSMIQVQFQNMATALNQSPKFHAELAGQGIEYDFGQCKGWP